MLTARPFAHRGLHGGPIIENSLNAFAAAIDAGFGMECDVQLSHDGIAFVFHDEHLDRLTAERGLVDDRTAAMLDRVVLLGTDQPLPRLDALLRLIDGRAPLLVEIKASGRNPKRICRAVRAALEGYSGPVAIMSFNPLASAWFKRHAPHVPRGLVVTEQQEKGFWGAVKRGLSLWVACPDFLAYDIRDLPTSAFAARARRRGLPVLTWTVRNAAQEADAMVHADEIIFERPGHG